MTEPQLPSFAKETVPVSLEEEMRKSFLDYAMSVIVSRALPDARDGLKPVHRRVLFAMQEANNVHNRPYVKCARIVGEGQELHLDARQPLILIAQLAGRCLREIDQTVADERPPVVHPDVDAATVLEIGDPHDAGQRQGRVRGGDQLLVEDLAVRGRQAVEIRAVPKCGTAALPGAMQTWRLYLKISINLEQWSRQMSWENQWRSKSF